LKLTKSIPVGRAEPEEREPAQQSAFQPVSPVRSAAVDPAEFIPGHPDIAGGRLINRPNGNLGGRRPGEVRIGAETILDSIVSIRPADGGDPDSPSARENHVPGVGRQAVGLGVVPHLRDPLAIFGKSQPENPVAGIRVEPDSAVRILGRIETPLGESGHGALDFPFPVYEMETDEAVEGPRQKEIGPPRGAQEGYSDAVRLQGPQPSVPELGDPLVVGDENMVVPLD
jgi:hypothetical protein